MIRDLIYALFVLINYKIWPLDIKNDLQKKVKKGTFYHICSHYSRLYGHISLHKLHNHVKYY